MVFIYAIQDYIYTAMPSEAKPIRYLECLFGVINVGLIMLATLYLLLVPNFISKIAYGYAYGTLEYSLLNSVGW